MKSTSSEGTNVSAILLVVFIVLKATHLINWSWWWVFSPVLIPMAITVLFLALGTVLFFLTGKK